MFANFRQYKCPPKSCRRQEPGYHQGTQCERTVRSRGEGKSVCCGRQRRNKAEGVQCPDLSQKPHAPSRNRIALIHDEAKRLSMSDETSGAVMKYILGGGDY